MTNRRYSNKGLRLFFCIIISAAVIMPLHAPLAADALADSNILTEMSNAMAGISERVKPAVVNIFTSKIIKSQRTTAKIPKAQKGFSLGSGVIVSKDGYIVTCNHVIAGAEDILVKLNDNREFKGKVVGMDSKTDIAVIKIAAENLPTLPWGDSGKLKTGEIVMAFGNPFGLTQTVTMGIVSATGRSGMGIVDYEDFIQTDASINPGNSGGALVNANGEFVGINDAIYSTSGGNLGISFAVPSTMVKNIMDSIINKGRVIRGYIGVQVQQLSPELAKQFRLPNDKGILLNDVTEGAPAEKAGLKRGDIIVSIDGKNIEDAFYLRNQVAATMPNATIELGIMRDGKTLSFPLIVTELASDDKSAITAESENAIKGVAIQDLTADLSRTLGLKKGSKGIVVIGVDEDSRALGFLKRGDIIAEINKKHVKNTSEFRKLAAKIPNNQNVLLLVIRGGFNQYITITAQ